jgi:hypothetical protein
VSPIETFVTGLQSRMRVSRNRGVRITREVEDHLQTLAAQIEASGCSREDAEREAVTRFGTPSDVALIVREFEADQVDAAHARAWRALVVVATLAAATIVVVRSLPDESPATVILKMALLGVMAGAGALAVMRPHAGVTGALAVGVATVGLTVVISYEMSMTRIWPSFGACFRTVGGLLVLQGGLCAVGTALRPLRS